MNSQEEWAVETEESSTPFYTGSLRGYREFAMGVDEDDFVLKPIAYSRQFAKPDQDGWIKAVCGSSLPSSEQKPQRHESPDAACRCGFYVSYFPGQSFYPFDLKYAYAVTENSGKIILSTKGFRSAKIKISAFYVPESGIKKYGESISASKMLDGVPMYTSLKRMFRDFPQENLTSLIGINAVEISHKHAEMSDLYKRYAKNPWRTLLRHPKKFLNDF